MSSSVNLGQNDEHVGEVPVHIGVDTLFHFLLFYWMYATLKGFTLPGTWIFESNPVVLNPACAADFYWLHLAFLVSFALEIVKIVLWALWHSKVKAFQGKVSLALASIVLFLSILQLGIYVNGVWLTSHGVDEPQVAKCAKLHQTCWWIFSGLLVIAVGGLFFSCFLAMCVWSRGNGDSKASARSVVPTPGHALDHEENAHAPYLRLPQEP